MNEFGSHADVFKHVPKSHFMVRDKSFAAIYWLVKVNHTKTRSHVVFFFFLFLFCLKTYICSNHLSTIKRQNACFLSFIKTYFIIFLTKFTAIWIGTVYFVVTHEIKNSEHSKLMCNLLKDISTKHCSQTNISTKKCITRYEIILSLFPTIQLFKYKELCRTAEERQKQLVEATE